jgi:ribosomal RNA-processing protein 8
MEAAREKLKGARFRWINEMLYTTTGASALREFCADATLFGAYHEGYRAQVAKWPEDPLDRIIELVRTHRKAQPQGTTLRVADLGCGLARLAATLTSEDGDGYEVHSFDLVAANDRVVACNIAHVPLADASVDVAVFCLALMGTDLVGFVAEARRILVPGTGRLEVAEAKSRIEDNDRFVRGMAVLGFRHVATIDDNTMFVLFRFVRINGQATLPPAKIHRAKAFLNLKPCVYKQR